MKSTPLLEEHKKLGAKLVDFAGWQMPLQYVGILQEHQAVRNSVGVFDVSHMGEFFVTGKDAQSCLNYLVPQDVASLLIGKALYSQLINEDAGIIDDLLIYRVASEEFLLIVNASRLDVDFAWIERHSAGYDVEVKDVSNQYSLIAVQGPNAPKVIENMGLGLDEQPSFMQIIKARLESRDVLISRSGYTGEDGFEILVDNNYASFIWESILLAGADFGIKPVGLGARDTLRLEAALLLYGHDMDEKKTPVEAGLKWAIAKDKKADYIGKEKIQCQIKNGISEKLIGFKLLDKGIAREGSRIFKEDKEVGYITSGGFSPLEKKGFGLGYVNDVNLKLGDKIYIDIRGKKVNAVVAKRPFIKKSYVKN